MCSAKEISVVFIDSLAKNFPECRENEDGSRNLNWIYYPGLTVDRLILRCSDGWEQTT